MSAVAGKINSTTEPSAQGVDLIDEAIEVISVVAVFAVPAYAGYKMVKRWSSSGPA